MREVSNTGTCSVRWQGKVKSDEVGRMESHKHDEVSRLCKDLNYLGSSGCERSSKDTWR